MHWKFFAAQLYLTLQLKLLFLPALCRHWHRNHRECNRHMHWRQCNGVCRQYDRVCRQYDGVCRQYNGVCRRYDGVYRQYNGVCRQCNGVCRQYDRVCRQYDGVCRQYDWVCRQYNRVYRQYDWVCKQYYGVCRQCSRQFTNRTKQCCHHNCAVESCGSSDPHISSQPVYVHNTEHLPVCVLHSQETGQHQPW